MAEGESKAPVASSSKSGRYSLKELHYEKSLEELAAAGASFRVVAHHSYNLSLYDIMPVDLVNDDLFRLNEEIQELVEDSDSTFKKPPRRLDIVLAKKDDGLYHRCIIKEISWDKKYAAVYWLDVGGGAEVECSSLRPVNDAIMQFPRLSYAVIVDGMYTHSNYVLWSEFEREMDKIMKYDFKMTVGGPLESAAYLFSARKVNLAYNDSTKMIDIKDFIKSLKTWEWESFSRLQGTDDEICENGKWGKTFRTSFQDQFPFPYKLSSINCHFPATVSKVIPDPTDPNKALLRILFLSHKYYFNYMNVLHYQMARYAEHIQECNFFPAVDEPCLFRLADKEEYRKNVKCLGHWVRGVRYDKDLVYLFDFDDLVPFAMLPEEDYDMRRLYTEFFKVPCLCITVRPTSNGKPLTIQQAEMIFKPLQRYNFQVIKDREEESSHSPYEVSFRPVDIESERCKTVANFLINFEV